MKTGFLVLVFACVLNIAAEPARAQAIQHLWFPPHNWRMDISVSDFEVVAEEVSSDGLKYFLGASLNEADGRLELFSSLEIRIEPAEAQGDSVSLLDFAIRNLEKTKKTSRGNILRGKIKTLDYNGVPVSRYDSVSALAQNVPLQIPQQSMEAYFVKGDAWIVIRISAQSLQDYEVKAFQSVLGSVHFVDTTATPTTSLDYYLKGRSLMLQKKFSEAIEFLGVALKLEQQKRALEIADWRAMVKDLTASYNAIGNRDRTKETLSYGIGEDPTFPMFHLAMARLYAANGDLEQTIASLEQAFLHKDNYTDNHGRIRPLPNPMSDPQFEQFKKNDKFRKAVKAMMK